MDSQAGSQGKGEGGGTERRKINSKAKPRFDFFLHHYDFDSEWGRFSMSPHLHYHEGRKKFQEECKVG